MICVSHGHSVLNKTAAGAARRRLKNCLRVSRSTGLNTSLVATTDLLSKPTQRNPNELSHIPT